MAKNRVPILVKHMTVAIYKKGGIDGSTKKDRFRSAWNIARARLTEYGFLAKGSEDGPASNIRLTGKGLQRESQHRNERGGAAKNTMFDLLYEQIEDDAIKGKE